MNRSTRPSGLLLEGPGWEPGWGKKESKGKSEGKGQEINSSAFIWGSVLVCLIIAVPGLAINAIGHLSARVTGTEAPRMRLDDDLRRWFEGSLTPQRQEWRLEDKIEDALRGQQVTVAVSLDGGSDEARKRVAQATRERLAKGVEVWVPSEVSDAVRDTVAAKWRNKGWEVKKSGWVSQAGSSRSLIISRPSPTARQP
jgi:hypothetical protein